ncbi:MAG: YabP/YqfC family sporulation protein [Halanaerobium sp.]|nr:YabP/YqfC family sporulation protein [Halanaerobium sp.]
MDNIPESLRRRFTEIFGLPEEIMLNLPLLMMVGRDLVIIENHQGLQEYLPELIELKTSRGSWSFAGSKMEIMSIDQELVKIRGQIKEIRFNLGDEQP